MLMIIWKGISAIMIGYIAIIIHFFGPWGDHHNINYGTKYSNVPPPFAVSFPKELAHKKLKQTTGQQDKPTL